MIRCIAGDVEIFPNMFSITFVDLSDYLVKCSCKSDDGKKDIPLINKYTVAEIKEKLNSVKTWKFYITDTDDSQLMELLAFINGMQVRRVEKVDKEGLVYEEVTRTDFYGYNINNYDNYMIAAFLMYFNRFDTTKALIKHLYNISKEIIDLQNRDRDEYFNHPTIKLLRNYRLPYYSVDVMTLFALNKAGVLIDKETGERKAYPKSLKQTSINLQWHELLEFSLPPVNDEERVYYDKINSYKSLTNEELTMLISPFDRYIIPMYIEKMMYYNLNDVFIVCEIVRQKIDEVRLRYSISKSFNINVLSSARSNISDKLAEKFYSELSGLHPSNFTKLKTERTKLSFKKIIFDTVRFKTPEMQSLLEEIKQLTIYRTNKDSFTREVFLFDQYYTLATGGLHSKDLPRVLKSTDEYTYIHWDISSFYPSLMINYNIAPAHLNEKVFIKLLKFLRDTRINAKHGGDIEVMPGLPNKVVAEVLKIVINAIYGKLGFEKKWFYDRLAQMKVTLNGQLMIMMLIEELGLNGIQTVSANTDGIVVKLYNNKKDIFNAIADAWKKQTGFEADSEDYAMYINRDINNYIVRELNGKTSYTGAFDPKQYIKDLTKGYDMPIVAEAVVAYLLDNVPVMETLRNATNILDFCKTQNVGRKYELQLTKVDKGEIKHIAIQRNTRFYIGLNGGVLAKVANGARNRLAANQKCVILNSLDDVPISERNIDYKYYYNECFKLINPILLGISSKGKGKTIGKKYSGMYNPLFDIENE